MHKSGELQQRVAAGEKLTFHQDDITFVGDAIEVRLNAWHEDLSPVLGGVVHTLRSRLPLRSHRTCASMRGLLQRRRPGLFPATTPTCATYCDGQRRHETLTRLIAILEGGLEIRETRNSRPMCNHPGLADPDARPATRNRVPHGYEPALDVADRSVAAQKQTVLSQVPDFPRRPGAHDPACGAVAARHAGGRFCASQPSAHYYLNV